MSLHIRKKRNKSGSVSIQIIDCSHRKYKVIGSIVYVSNKEDMSIYLDMANSRLQPSSWVLSHVFLWR